jgi:hypothetical protein
MHFKEKYEPALVSWARVKSLKVQSGHVIPAVMTEKYS